MSSGESRSMVKERKTAFVIKRFSRHITESLFRDSQRGLIGIIGFLLLSIAAYQMQIQMPALPSHWYAFLGPAPTGEMIGVALMVYAFSALLLLIASFDRRPGRFKSCSHLAYLLPFYFFFYYTGELQNYFVAVLVTGLSLLSLEYYRAQWHERQS